MSTDTGSIRDVPIPRRPPPPPGQELLRPQEGAPGCRPGVHVRACFLPCVPGTVLSPEDTKVNKKDKIPTHRVEDFAGKTTGKGISLTRSEVPAG